MKPLQTLPPKFIIPPPRNRLYSFIVYSNKCLLPVCSIQLCRQVCVKNDSRVWFLVTFLSVVDQRRKITHFSVAMSPCYVFRRSPICNIDSLVLFNSGGTWLILFRDFTSQPRDLENLNGQVGNKLIIIVNIPIVFEG